MRLGGVPSSRATVTAVVLRTSGAVTSLMSRIKEAPGDLLCTRSPLVPRLPIVTPALRVLLQYVDL
jgi:hypothetical protein